MTASESPENISPQKKGRRPETPQPLSAGTRTILIGVGLFLVLQAIFIAVFIFTYLPGFAPIHNKLLAVWAGLSIIAGALLIIRGAQSGSSHSISAASSRTALFGDPDSTLTLASLSAMVQEGVVLLRSEKIIYANPALAYLLGVQEDDLVDTNIKRHIHAEDLAMLDLNELEPDLNSVSRTTLRLTTSLGDYRWVICNVFYVFWENEPATLLILENIGPLKQAQRSLEEHEQQSRIFLERTPLGVAMFDALGQLKIANTAWYSVWSNIPGGASKRYNILQDSFLPRADVERAIRNAFSKKEAGVSNLEHATPWGETRWYNIDFHPMLTPVGNLIGVIMVQQDMTDSMRSQRRETELADQLTAIRLDYSIMLDRYSKLLDMLPAALACFDDSGTIRIWNRAAEQHFGIPRHNLLGLNIKTAEHKLGPYKNLIQKSGESPEAMLREQVQYEDENGQSHAEVVSVHTVGTGCNRITVLRIIDAAEALSTLPM